MYDDINSDYGDDINSDNEPSSNISLSNANGFNENRHLLKRPVGHLPYELLKFIDNDSYSLLVKGGPGTGKTIFALTLMDNLNHNSNYFYISTRMSIKQLSFFYPWINKFRTKNESKHEYKFEDARLDEPESLFERITNQLMDVKSPLIIIDTWDAIASFMDKESRLNNERVLQIWRERAGAKLIFLSESSDINIFDSMVDGVISLNYEYESSKYYRKLFFNKLRGIPINSSQYYFTLFKGFFWVFDSINNLNLFEKMVNKNHRKRLAFHRNFICKNKNDILINLFKNKLVILEFDSNISNQLIVSILLKPLLCLLASNNLILINNFHWNFYLLLKEIVLSLHYDRRLANNLLNDLLDHTKLSLDNVDMGEHRNYFEINDILYSSIPLDKILPSPFQNNIYSQSKILNILDGNNLLHLIYNFKFLENIKRLPFNNIIIIKKSSINHSNNILLSEGNYYRITIKDSNVLLISRNNSNTIFGALSMSNNCHIDWYPVY